MFAFRLKQPKPALPNWGEKSKMSVIQFKCKKCGAQEYIIKEVPNGNNVHKGLYCTNVFLVVQHTLTVVKENSSI